MNDHPNPLITETKDAIGGAPSKVQKVASSTKDDQSHENGTQLVGTGKECCICNERIIKKCILEPCRHDDFDVWCLLKWFEKSPTCPVCRAEVTALHCSKSAVEAGEKARKRSHGRLRKYLKRNDRPVALIDTRPVPRDTRQVTGEAWRVGSWPSHRDEVEEIEEETSEWLVSVTDGQLVLPNLQQRSIIDAPAPEERSLARRRRVYERQLFSMHMGANSTSGYRNFTPREFANSPALQSRARTFLRRELQVFTHLESRDRGFVRNRDFVMEYIVAILRVHDPKGAGGHGPQFLETYFTKECSTLLLHELVSWLRSPFSSLEEWDRNVQYLG